MSVARAAVRPAVTDVYELISDRPLGSGNYGQVFLSTIIERICNSANEHDPGVSHEES